MTRRRGGHMFVFRLSSIMDPWKTRLRFDLDAHGSRNLPQTESNGRNQQFTKRVRGGTSERFELSDLRDRPSRPRQIALLARDQAGGVEQPLLGPLDHPNEPGIVLLQLGRFIE